MNRIARPGPLDFLLLALVSIIWGSAFVAMKVAVLDVGAMWTATMRVVVGFAALLPFFFLMQRQFPANNKTWFLIALIASLNMVVPFIMISWAMKHIEAGVGSLLLGTTPFMAMVLTHFFTDDEKINRMKLIAVFLAVSGIAVLVGQDAVYGLKSSAVLAQLAIIAAGGCYVTAGLFMRSVDMKPVAFTTLALGVGSAMLVLVSTISVGLPQEMPTMPTVWALLWLGLFPTGLAYVMRFYLVKRVGVSTFALAMNTVPIFGIILGALLLGEIVEWTTLAALGLVICGLMVARMGTPAEKVE